MNEIKKIHLGRQPFTIALDAHKALRAYLEEIERQVGAKSEVLKEVESRMAELLIERGITGEKVILGEDVEYLKEQLGDPGDFKDDEHEAPAPEPAPTGEKRLYRDSQNAMIAGVCSGIAAFFGIDATIVRLIFVVALFAGGAAIPVYLVLWLVMPEAKTPSERLQMQGKAVTVDSIKELVDRADVKGAADRAGKAFGGILERTGKILSAIIGVALVVFASVLFMTLSASSAYVFTHHDKLIANTLPFPLGHTETLFAILCAVVGVIFSLFILLIGMAMIRRRWTAPGWITAALIGLVLLAGAAAVAVGPDAVYSVRDRYEAAEQTSLRSVDKFTSVKVIGNNIKVGYYQSSSYQVGVKYLGNYDPKDVKTSVKDGVLTVDVRGLRDKDCENFCIARGQYDEVVIKAPKLTRLQNGDDTWENINSGDHFETYGPRYNIPDYH